MLPLKAQKHAQVYHVHDMAFWFEIFSL